MKKLEAYKAIIEKCVNISTWYKDISYSLNVGNGNISETEIIKLNFYYDSVSPVLEIEKDISEAECSGELENMVIDIESQITDMINEIYPIEWQDVV